MNWQRIAHDFVRSVRRHLRADELYDFITTDAKHGCAHEPVRVGVDHELDDAVCLNRAEFFGGWFT